MYNEWFFEEEGRVAAESAAVVVPWVLEQIGGARIVADIGCGTGEWLAVAASCGCELVQGYDAHVPERLLRIDPDHFYKWDFAESPVDCGLVDLAICLEVLEHLPLDAAESVIHGLSFAKSVLFSAATPGQPGIGHINCQPHEYWHRLFGKHDKTPEFIGDKFTEPVADFYRRNMFLYR